MSVELLVDRNWNRVIKYGHYLFVGDKRTVVEGYGHTLYFIDSNYISTLEYHDTFKCRLNSKNKWQLDYDLSYMLNNLQYDSEIINKEDLEIYDEDLFYMLCCYLDIDTVDYKIVQLKSYTIQPCYFDICHGGTCVVLRNEAKTELNIITNFNTLQEHYYNYELRFILGTDSLILKLIIEQLETYKFNKETDFIRIVSEDVYNNYIKKVNVDVTLEDPGIYKYIDLYERNKHKIRDADFITDLDGNLRDITKFKGIL